MREMKSIKELQEEMSINYRQLANQVTELDDTEKWEWVKGNQDLNITVNLDNDDTFVTFDNFDEEEDAGEVVIRFDGYLGWSDGIHTLLDVFNIKFEDV